MDYFLFEVKYQPAGLTRAIAFHYCCCCCVYDAGTAVSEDGVVAFAPCLRYRSLFMSDVCCWGDLVLLRSLFGVGLLRVLLFFGETADD